MIAGLLLAAGGARRFGSQKLLAKVDGIAIAKRAALTLAAEADELWVVVGCEAESVRTALEDIDAQFVENRQWADGLSSSLAAGIAALAGRADAVLIGLGDQPFVDRAAIRGVVGRWRETGKPIVAARYRGTRGHPVLLESSVFAEASRVSGDVGARDLITRDPDRVAFVDIDTDPPRDVDTTDDLASLES